LQKIWIFFISQYDDDVETGDTSEYDVDVETGDTSEYDDVNESGWGADSNQVGATAQARFYEKTGVHQV